MVRSFAVLVQSGYGLFPVTRPDFQTLLLDLTQSYFKVKGVPITIVLDVVELPKASLDVSSQQMCTECLELVALMPEYGTGIQGDSRIIWY